MYCWGQNTEYQLEVDKDNPIKKPIYCSLYQFFKTHNIPFKSNSQHIWSLSFSKSSSVFLANDGIPYVFNKTFNDSITEWHKLEFNELLSCLCCGDIHVIGITQNRRIVSSGFNCSGQLERMLPNNSFQSSYTSLNYLEGPISDIQIAKVACGSRHSLALSRNGELFSWGCNLHGQLGLASNDKSRSSPAVVKNLNGLPLQDISAGGFHNLIVTVSGSVFAWGSNIFGQLGIGRNSKHYKYKDSSNFPVAVKELRSRSITNVFCGSCHSAALSSINGKVFTFGRNDYYQLGHKEKRDFDTPLEPSFLSNEFVYKVACGDLHTVFVVKSVKGYTVFSSGSNKHGQLGSDSAISHADNFKIPIEIPSVGHIACGSSNSVILESNDREFFESNNLAINHLDSAAIARILADRDLTNEDFNLLKQVFSSSSSINASFLLPENQHMSCSNSNVGIDWELLSQFSQHLSSLANPSLDNMILNTLRNSILPTLKPNVPDYEALRQYLLLFQLHIFLNNENVLSLVIPFGKALLGLSDIPSDAVFKWWKSMPSSCFLTQLSVFKKAVIFLCSANNIDGQIRCNAFNIALRILIHMHKTAEFSGLIDMKEFYLPEYVDHCRPEPLNFFNIHEKCPFILNIKDKAEMLRMRSESSMVKAVHEINKISIERNVFSDEGFIFEPFELHLKIDRKNIVSSTFEALKNAPNSNLRKKLQVEFITEDAVDGGGVQKEFFMLIFKEIIQPKYELLELIEDSQIFWFKKSKGPDNLKMFWFLGVICGLAVYNGSIIYLSFPNVLYKKLLTEKLCLNDLFQLSKSSLIALNDILSYDKEDFVDEYSLNFHISDADNHEVDLIENGEDIEVTRNNRHEFVESYYSYILNKFRFHEFNQFKKGFFDVCNEDVCRSFTAVELMKAVSGCPIIDLSELESCTRYKGMFNSEHPTVQYFWKAIYSLTTEEKRKFLCFLSGTDRVPIEGLKSLGFVIDSMNRADESHLPVAITCCHALLLPAYSTFELLLKKLKTAIYECEGFGLA